MIKMMEKSLKLTPNPQSMAIAHALFMVADWVRNFHVVGHNPTHSREEN
jgi:phosphohistidine phosphatase SixA